MRILNQQELAFVCGAEGVCTPEDSGNDFAGVDNTQKFGDDLINLYEGAVAAVSHIIERVADAL
ncbi:MAG: hypothetical protein ACREQZ_01915 [Woeseiaceae bacterium]